MEKALSMGANEFLVSTDKESMKKNSRSIDLIINTVSAQHEVSHYVPLLNVNGTIVQVGLVTQPHSVKQMTLFPRKSIAGSCIGGTKSTQDCIDFCASKGIEPNIELITADKLDEVYDLLGKKNDAIVRYVIDIKASLKKEGWGSV